MAVSIINGVEKGKILMDDLYIFIDDTGASGNISKLEIVNNNHKSYVAIVMSESEVNCISPVIDHLQELLYERYNTREFHFTDIYQSRNKFEQMDKEEKISLFECFSDVFKEFDVLWYIQSLDKKSKMMIEESKLKKPMNIEWSIIILLLKQISDDIKDQKLEYNNIFVKIDSGIYKNGHKISLSNSTDLFKNCCANVKIEFLDSTESPIIQLADFAAYSYTRHLFLISKIIDIFPKKNNTSDDFYNKINDSLVSVMSKCNSKKLIAEVISIESSIDEINKKFKKLKE